MRFRLSFAATVAPLLLLFAAVQAVQAAALGTDASSQPGSEVDVAESPSDVAESGLFLSPSNIADRVFGGYQQSLFGLKNAVEAQFWPVKSPFMFWERAEALGQILQNYVQQMLKEADKDYGFHKFTDITSTMDHIISSTSAFRGDIQRTLETHNITIHQFSQELEGFFELIVNRLEDEFPSPDKAPSHAERAVMVNYVLDQTEETLLHLTARSGIQGDIVVNYFSVLRPHVEVLTVAVGDVIEQHPNLIATAVCSVAALLIPEGWLLKPLLSMFGFGPGGPVKGSVAAWLQRRFWGRAVKSGSCFALLQEAAMSTRPWHWVRIMWASVVAWIVAHMPF